MDRLPRALTADRMTPADVPAVVAIEALSFPSGAALSESLPTPEQRFYEELSRPWTEAWVARDEGGKAVAFLLAWVVADEMHVLHLATHPAERRRGIGAELVAAAVSFERSNRTRQLLLEVRRSNEGAKRLYRAAGFFVSRVRRSYYADGE